MFFCAVPIGVFAQADDVQTDIENDVSMEATSAFGSMLTEAIDTQDIDADSPYFISDLIFDGNKATASYYNEAECTLVVAVYDEETEQMLDSAVTSVEAESLEKAVSFSSLPESFVAKAFLLDENNASLCKPYTCNENITAYKEFIGKTVEDFDEDRVINLDESLTNNFVVLTDDTIIVNGNNETNVLESADVENDEYIFSNIDEQIKNLRVGDMFYLDNGDEENITVIKVASISIEGDKAVIIADNTTLAEAFEYVKINTEAATDEFEYDGTNADEGVTYLGDVDCETGEAVAPADSDVMTMAVEPDGEGSVSKKFKIYEEGNIKADLNVKVEVKTKLYIGKEYGEVSLTVEPAINVNIEVEDKIPLKEISLGKLKTISPIAGVFVNIKPAFVVEFSGKLTVSGDLTFTLGVGWNSNSGFVNKCQKPSFEPEVKVEVTFFVGFDLKPELTVLHENVASASMSGVIGAEVEAIRTTDKGENHSCSVCTDGNIQGKLEIKVELTVAKTTPIGGEWEATLIKLTIKIANFYYSETNDKFGWGECPYKNGSSGGSVGDSGESGGDSGNTGGGTETTYTLVFLDGDGRVFAVDYLNYGDTIYIPDEIPEKEYHKFKYWADVPATMPAYDVTITPVFERLPVKLVPKEGSTTIIDYSGDYNFIYGLEECLTVDRLSDYLSVENDGYFEVTCVKGYEPYVGTGAIVKLYDSIDDSLLEAFYVVIFGDLNGDSYVQAYDARIAIDEGLYLTNWSQEFLCDDNYGFIPNPDYSPSKFMAANLDKDGIINMSDWSIINSASLGTAIIDQTTGEYDGDIIDAVSVGDIIDFGSYPQSQNADGTYNVEPIEWRVLENNNGELFLLSEKVLDAQPYHSTYGDITWAECSLRTWLNEDFYGTAFSESEQALISTSYLTNEDNPEYGTDGGADTEDKIFILSYSDSLKSDYGFSTSVDDSDTRVALASDYAIYYSHVNCDGDYTSTWWLRTPGSNSDYACNVSFYGHVSGSGYHVSSSLIGVRPALKLNLNSTASSSLETQSVSYTLDNDVNTIGFSYDNCIAGNTYTLLNVTDYGEGFELNSDNLYYINTVSADENGMVTASFIPKVNAENSVILLVGDFGNGTETVVVDEWYNEYTVTWNADGETVTQTVIEGAEIVAPENPEKVGYTFTGWTPQIPDAMPAEDLTFTATWTANSYNAVFDANSGKWADGAEKKTVPTDFNAEIKAPENPVKQGYVFSCWSPEIGVMDDVNGKEFTAQWLAATDTHYTVETYTMNTDGEYEKFVQTLSGTTNSAVTAEYSVENGFAFNAEKSVLSGTVAADNSLVLKVYIDRNTYVFETIVDGVSTETEYLYGAMIAEPATPVKADYKFIEWNARIPETMPAEDVTVTAVFEKSYICPDCGNEILGEAEINAHIASEARMKAIVKIQNNNGEKTINYGETLKLTAVTDGKPADAIIVWYVDGVRKGVGETYSVTFESGTKTVEVKLEDTSGKVLKDSSGNEISETEKVSVNSGFWQKIVSFFKNLFRIDRTVEQ